MELATALNLVQVIEGQAPASAELLRDVKHYGTHTALHRAFAETLRANGFISYGSKTDVDAKHTPHIRDWNLLTDEQRSKFIAITTAKAARAPKVEAPSEEATQ